MRSALVAVSIGSILVTGCHRESGATNVGDAGVETDAAPMSLTPTPPKEAPETPEKAVVPDSSIEATRARVTKIDDVPILRANAAMVREHFGNGVLLTQRVSLAGGMRALLVSAETGDPKPLVLAVDQTSGIVWKKDKPVAGVIPKVTEMALAARPNGGVVLFLYDEPTHIVAARMWDPDGSPFADLQLFEIERCDALSAVRWAGHGWIVVAARPGGGRAQLLRESGVTAWGDHGTPVGAAWRAAAPATLAVGNDTWFLVQHAPAPGAPIHVSTDHALAFAYSAAGVPAAEARDLGAVKKVEKTDERIVIEGPPFKAILDGRSVSIER